MPLKVPLDFGREQLYSLDFEGIVNTVKRVYNDKDASETLRRWAEDYMHIISCDGCQGQRLKKEALWFKIDNKNIAELSEMDITHLQLWLNDLENRLSERQNMIAKDVLKEIRTRLVFYSK